MEFRHYPIRQKLMAMSLLASSGALLLASAAFMAYDFLTYRSSLVKRLSSLEEIISLNTASAVVFNDKDSAAKTIESLKARSSIIDAAIYTPDGNVFASWHRDPKVPSELSPLPPGGQEFHQYDRHSLSVFHPMILDQSVIGTVYMKSDLSELTQRLQRYLGIGAGVLIISFFAAALISFKVGQKISEPILHLVKVAQAVSEKKDYSVRAAGDSQDESGLLIRTFNEMLTKIQVDGQALQSAHNELEQRVQERTAQLTVANKELEAFSYSVSHDLRAPLRHIGGFSDLLQNDSSLQSNEAGRRYLKMITESARQMGRLIDDLLAFSRMGRAELQKTTIDLNRMIQGILEDLKVDLKGREILWSIGALPEMHGDPSLMRQVWVNLISNAIKYTRKRPDPRIDLGCTSQNGDDPVFFVRDNGVGFDMKYVEKLFGVFQRLHSSDDFEGTGIGLANVRRIVQRHGGRAWAEGRVDQGATFYFSLPHQSSLVRSAEEVRLH